LAGKTNTGQRKGETPKPPWHRRPGVALVPLLLAGLVVWLLFGLAGTFSPSAQRITGVDPVGYYSWVRSLAFDHDLDFENEYRALVPKAARIPGSPVDPDASRTATGHLGNVFSIGPGILWSPFILFGHITAGAAGLEQDGLTQPYHTGVFLANIVYGLAGVVLLYGALRAWFPRGTSALAAFAVWACSPVLYYTYAQMAMSHACSFFAMALFLFLWARYRGKDAFWPWVAIGAALGLAALVRWQNATFCLIPAIDLLSGRKKKDLAKLALCAIASVVVFFPQMVGWKILYGSFLTIPQGQGFMGWLHPELLRLFVSGEHGLLTWTPLCGVGLVGLFLWPKQERRVYVAMAVAVLLQCYVSACAGSAGWSFGMRRLVNCAPFFAVGLALVFVRLEKRRGWVAVAVALFALWNFLFVLQYAGFLDTLYADQALLALAQEHKVAPQRLVEMTRLPNGEPFNAVAFIMGQGFPREHSPTLQQFVPDKLTVLIAFAMRVLGLSPGPSG
jgi:dolichyl-phosphate-mannose-protein mannosyltransferase